MKRTHMTIRLTEREKKLLQQGAEFWNKSVTDYLLDLAAMEGNWQRDIRPPGRPGHTDPQPEEA